MEGFNQRRSGAVEAAAVGEAARAAGTAGCYGGSQRKFRGMIRCCARSLECA